MNRKALEKDIGYRVKLVPPAQLLTADNEPLPPRDEDWIVMNVTDEYVEINRSAGYFYHLGQDHIRSFSTDPQRATDGLRHGFLQLHVQLFIRGADVFAVPNHRPGAPVAPPAINVAARACHLRAGARAHLPVPDSDP